MALGDRKDWKHRPYVSRGVRIPGVGPTPCELMLIGERPGKDEDRKGEALVGIGGVEVERYLSAAGVSISSVYHTYMVKDYRDGLPPEDWEIARDSSTLQDEIDLCTPVVIATLGKHVTEHFLQRHVSDFDMVRGVPHSFIHPDVGPITIVPISHPPASFYSPDNQPIVLSDFACLGRFLRGNLQPVLDLFPDPTYIHERGHINPFHISWASVHPAHQIAIDTEGWRHNPWGLSFSTRPGFGIVCRKHDPSIAIFAHNLQQACLHDPTFTIYLHNSLHDLEVLRCFDIDVPDDRFIDTMVLSYLLSTEPQGLKPLAYRHAGMRMNSYEDTVKPYYDAVFEEWLRTAAELPDLPDWEEEFVLLVEGRPKIKKPWGIARHLRKIIGDSVKAQDAGKEFDYAKRWENIDDYKKIPVLRALGEPPEPSLDYVPVSEAVPYAGRDADATLRIAPILMERIESEGMSDICRIDHSVLPMLDRMQHVGMKADPDHFDHLADECTERMSVLQHQISALTGAIINPDSGDQVAALLFDQLRLDRQVDFDIRKTDDGSRYSTNDKILEALRFTHPVVGLVCDYREISKVRSSFCWPISRYARQSVDRRIHPNIRATRVITGRLSATKPNLLAIPVRSDLGKRVRDGFICDDGHTLATWDLDQIEMRYMTDESQDPVLLECFRLGLDVHSKTASHIFGHKYEDIVADKSLRKKLRDPAKRVGFGVITGITEIGLVAQLRLANATKNGLPMGEGGDPWTEGDCKRMIDEYFKLHTGVRDYFDRCRAEARRYGYVTDRWGRRRYLPGVHSPVARNREEALRQSHSHKIQAGAQSIMKQGMAKLWEHVREWHSAGIWVEPLLQVHDEMLWEMEDDPGIRQMVSDTVIDCLCRTITLSVPLGAKGGFGPTWGSLEK